MPPFTGTIAITGLNATDNPGPGVAVIRCLRAHPDFRGRIVGLAYDALDPGVYMADIADDVYLLPYPSEGGRALQNRLEEIHARTPLDVILPTLDAELGPFIKIAPALERLGVRTFLPTEAGLKLRSKATLAKLEETHGIAVPRGLAISDPAIALRPDWPLAFPLMVKGQFYEAHLVSSPAELDTQFRRLAARWGLPVIVQEYVPGAEYDIVALGDGTGQLIGAVPMRKMQLTDKGKAWGGVTIEDPILAAFVRHVIGALRWRGPCELEIMRRRSDGQPVLLEINPRFPAWVYLSVGSGQNLPWATVQLALGQAVEPLPPYKVGTMFIRHSVDMIYPMEQFQEIATLGEVHRLN